MSFLWIVWGKCLNSSFLHVPSVENCPSDICWKDYCLCIKLLSAFVNSQLKATVRIYFYTFNYVALIYIFILMPVSCHLHDCKFVVSFKIRKYLLILHFLLFLRYFEYSGFFGFSYKFVGQLFNFCTK